MYKFSVMSQHQQHLNWTKSDNLHVLQNSIWRVGIPTVRWFWKRDLKCWCAAAAERSHGSIIHEDTNSHQRERKKGNENSVRKNSKVKNTVREKFKLFLNLQSFGKSFNKNWVFKKTFCWKSWFYFYTKFDKIDFFLKMFSLFFNSSKKLKVFKLRISYWTFYRFQIDSFSTLSRVSMTSVFAKWCYLLITTIFKIPTVEQIQKPSLDPRTFFSPSLKFFPTSHTQETKQKSRNCSLHKKGFAYEREY